MKRRNFLTGTIGLTTLAMGVPVVVCRSVAAEKVTAASLPRWRGFNLLEKFVKRDGGNPPYRESDLAWMQEWGFDFARLPLSYLCWTDPSDWLKFREDELKDLDEVARL